MEFASDNAAGVAPTILDALVRANAGFAVAYGDDASTQRLEHRFSELFERDVAVFLVSTGTAANALALAHLSRHTPSCTNAALRNFSAADCGCLASKVRAAN